MFVQIHGNKEANASDKEHSHNILAYFPTQKLEEETFEKHSGDDRLSMTLIDTPGFDVCSQQDAEVCMSRISRLVEGRLWQTLDEVRFA